MKFSVFDHEWPKTCVRAVWHEHNIRPHGRVNTYFFSSRLHTFSSATHSRLLKQNQFFWVFFAENSSKLSIFWFRTWRKWLQCVWIALSELTRSGILPKDYEYCRHRTSRGYFIGTFSCFFETAKNNIHNRLISLWSFQSLCSNLCNEDFVFKNTLTGGEYGTEIHAPPEKTNPVRGTRLQPTASRRREL